ncbi:hypothetical protein ONZ45_g14934 [Pleurotus djamor]|nr:hypothetical protein ONZ45_g14934 [Pleurotus djamor]
MSRILQLPDELLQDIMEQLESKSALVSFMHTCRRAYVVSEAILLRSIVIIVESDRRTALRSLCEYLSPSHPRRRLFIQSFSIIFAQGSATSQETQMLDELVPTSTNLRSLALRFDVYNVLSHGHLNFLYYAAPQLSLRRFCLWKSRGSNIPIASFLASQVMLEHLELNESVPKVDVPLLSGLRLLRAGISPSMTLVLMVGHNIVRLRMDFPSVALPDADILPSLDNLTQLSCSVSSEKEEFFRRFLSRAKNLQNLEILSFPSWGILSALRETNLMRARFAHHSAWTTPLTIQDYDPTIFPPSLQFVEACNRWYLKTRTPVSVKWNCAMEDIWRHDWEADVTLQ